MPQDPLANLGIPATAPSSTTPAPDPLAALGIPATPTAAPETASAVSSAPGVGEQIATGAKEAAGDAWNVAKSMLGGGGQDPFGIEMGGKAILGQFGAYEAARRAGKSPKDAIAAAAIQQAKENGIQKTLQDRHAEFQAAPTQATARGLVDAALVAATIYGTHQAGSLLEGATEAGAAEAGGAESVIPKSPEPAPTLAPSPKTGSWMTRLNPFRNRAAVEASAAQPGAEAAIHTATGAGTSGAVLAGNETVLDEPIAGVARQAKSAYQKIDDTVGFDLKEEKTQLGNDEYNLKQLGNTPADQAQKKTLQASITDSTQRIQQAQAKLRAAGIDPDSGDNLFKKAQAGKDFKSAVVKASSPDGTINVDKLVNSAKALRFAKRGDRLAQFMGQDNADAFMQNLEAAQKAGQTAVTVNRVVTWLGHVGAIVGGYEGARHLLGPILPE